MRPDGFSGEDGVEMEESELVPSSLAPIVPILRAANEIEEENPRVAYLCMSLPHIAKTSVTAHQDAKSQRPTNQHRRVLCFLS
jgi:hypothetical protein